MRFEKLLCLKPAPGTQDSAFVFGKVWPGTKIEVTHAGFTGDGGNPRRLVEFAQSREYDHLIADVGANINLNDLIPLDYSYLSLQGLNTETFDGGFVKVSRGDILSTLINSLSDTGPQGGPFIVTTVSDTEKQPLRAALSSITSKPPSSTDLDDPLLVASPDDLLGLCFGLFVLHAVRRLAYSSSWGGDADAKIREAYEMQNRAVI